MIDDLKSLIEKYKDSPDRNVQCARSVIACLCGAMHSRQTEKLMGECVEFSKSEISALKEAQRQADR